MSLVVTSSQRQAKHLLLAGRRSAGRRDRSGGGRSASLRSVAVGAQALAVGAGRRARARERPRRPRPRPRPRRAWLGSVAGDRARGVDARPGSRRGGRRRRPRPSGPWRRPGAAARWPGRCRPRRRPDRSRSRARCLAGRGPRASSSATTAPFTRLRPKARTRRSCRAACGIPAARSGPPARDARGPGRSGVGDAVTDRPRPRAARGRLERRGRPVVATTAALAGPTP